MDSYTKERILNAVSAELDDVTDDINISRDALEGRLNDLESQADRLTTYSVEDLPAAIQELVAEINSLYNDV